RGGIDGARPGLPRLCVRGHRPPDQQRDGCGAAGDGGRCGATGAAAAGRSLTGQPHVIARLREQQSRRSPIVQPVYGTVIAPPRERQSRHARGVQTFSPDSQKGNQTGPSLTVEENTSKYTPSSCRL